MFFYKEIEVFYLCILFIMSKGNLLGSNFQFYEQGLMFQDSILTENVHTV